jgi:predicted membrane-bound spermidine synthase/tetratricopeptide (TPR) repeat protein
MRRGLAYFLFLFSGATALCYEVAWTRRLVLVFGSTTTAVALILAAYMLGLALGSEAGGRLADRSRRPAVLYAAAEGLIGLYAFAFPWLVDAVRSVYLGLGTAATPVLFVGAFVLLLVPTFLMGATLPLLVRATVDDPSATGGVVGRLYGANILGAVLGTAATGFWLIEAAGVMGATRWAAGVNLAIAVVGFAAFRAATSSPKETAANDATTSAPASPAMRAALVSAFAAGLVGLAAEVLWTRLLTFTLQGFTYTFSAMLAIFLLGLALGGLAFGRVASRTTDPVRALARLHVAIGVLAASALLLLMSHYAITGKTWDLAGSIVGHADLRVRHIVQLLASSAVILLPPAFLMGGVFPLAAAAYRRGLGDLGARVGRLYAVNTVGCVMGSLVAGFVLAPTVGLTWGAAIVAMTSVAAAFVVTAIGGRETRRFRGPLVGAAAVAALVFVADPGRPFLTRSQVFLGDKQRENRLVETKNGAVCQVSIVDNERERYRLLYTDEFEAAGTKPEYRYMRLLAHLPVALADDPSRVLVICFGTGTTSGSVSTHSAVKRLDIVEISPEVLSVADEFRAVNRDVLHGGGRSDLDVAVHVDDGRNFVLRSKEQWGVITLEPLMPYTPAAIHLYTEDFYRECAPRLAPGGVMCQWIPLHAMNVEHLRQLVAAFTAVFPDSAVFFADGAIALIGGNGPMKIPYARVAERLSDPAAKDDLAAVGFDDPVRALATFVAGGEALRTFAAGVDPVTDERPVLEFFPLLNVPITHLWQNVQAMGELRDGYERLPVDLAGVANVDEVETRLYLALRAGQHLLHGARALEANGYIAKDRSRPPADAMAAALEARDAFRLAVSVDPDNQSGRRSLESLERALETAFGADALKHNELESAESHFRRALEFRSMRQEDVAWTRLAETLSRQEKFEDALEAATEATRLFPRGLDARCERAYARAALGDFDGAAADYRRALEGEDVETLEIADRPDESLRLRHDAERAFAAPPSGAAKPEFDAQIDAAMSGAKTARVPATHVLRILAADHPAEFAAHFAPDFASAALPAKSAADDARVRAALRRLALAGPAGTSDAAARVLAHVLPLPPATDAAAADALATFDPARLADVLAAKRAPAVVVECIHAAQKVRGTRFVDRFIDLLLDPSLDVRTAAQRALFAQLGDKVPRLARLDPSAYPSKPYRDAVDDVRAWWVRERDHVDSGH